MPQLNPAPWLLILLMSWFTYLALLPKTNKLKTPGNPSIKNNKCAKSHWNWPWL